MFLQILGACAAVLLVGFTLGPDGPWPVYAGAAFGGGYAVAWLRARLKYGRGITVAPSMPEPPPRH